MQTSKYLLSLLLLLVSTVSCKKSFLDVPDKTILLRQAYVKDLETTNDYLNGIYVELGSNFYSSYTGIYADVVSDNIKPVSGGTAMNAHYNWKQFADNERSVKFAGQTQNANGLWFAGYRIIRDCSFVIEIVDQYRNENEQAAARIKAEAYALRAFIHHILVSVFAQPYIYSEGATHTGIPYIKTSDWRAPISRQPVAEVYAAIIDDLNNAVALFPDNARNSLRLNKAAAMALLARVYLFKGEYNNSLLFAREVCLSVPVIDINAGYPNQLFKYSESSRTSESLFQIPPAGPATGYTTFFSGGYFRSIQRFLATDDIANLLQVDSTDVRSSWVIAQSGGYAINKFPVGVTGTISSPDADYYPSVLRSSEVFLTAAECFANLNKRDSAIYYLDIIRKRADTTATEWNGDNLLEDIYEERRKEFAFEGLRMFDLLRWKKPVVRGGGVGQPDAFLPYPSNKAVAPIPLSDVQTAGLKQNMDY